MKNNEEKNKIMWGALIGGIIGGSAYYFLSSEKSFVSKVGEKISDFGEMIEKSKIRDPKEAVSELETVIPEDNKTLNNVLNWTATGLSLWKKLKKGA